MKAPSKKRIAPTRRGAGYHHGDLRRALVEAAIEQLATRDARELSLRELARIVGVSTAAPYRHFASRDALVAAVAEEGFRALAEEIRAALAQAPPDPLTRLRESGVAYVRFAHGHPSHYRVMFGEAFTDRSAFPELRATAAESMALLMGVIEEGIAAGLLREADPRELALGAWSVVHGLASLLGSHQIAVLGLDADDPEELARTLAGSLISGVARGGPTATGDDGTST